MSVVETVPNKERNENIQDHYKEYSYSYSARSLNSHPTKSFKINNSSLYYLKSYYNIKETLILYVYITLLGKTIL